MQPEPGSGSTARRVRGTVRTVGFPSGADRLAAGSRKRPCRGVARVGKRPGSSRRPLRRCGGAGSGSGAADLVGSPTPDCPRGECGGLEPGSEVAGAGRFDGASLLRRGRTIGSPISTGRGRPAATAFRGRRGGGSASGKRAGPVTASSDVGAGPVAGPGAQVAPARRASLGMRCGAKPRRPGEGRPSGRCDAAVAARSLRRSVPRGGGAAERLDASLRAGPLLRPESHSRRPVRESLFGGSSERPKRKPRPPDAAGCQGLDRLLGRQENPRGSMHRSPTYAPDALFTWSLSNKKNHQRQRHFVGRSIFFSICCIGRVLTDAPLPKQVATNKTGSVWNCRPARTVGGIRAPGTAGGLRRFRAARRWCRRTAHGLFPGHRRGRSARSRTWRSVRRAGW